MEDQASLSSIVDALHAIRDELRQINQKMSQMATVAPRPSQPVSPVRDNVRESGGAPFRGKPPFRKPAGPGGGYKRPDAGAGFEGGPEEGAPFRFAKKPGFGRAPARSKGKLPPKKGGGYPKKFH
jgi:hypothetical protein